MEKRVFGNLMLDTYLFYSCAHRLYGGIRLV